MERQLEQILKEQIIEEFHKQELDNLIVFFLAKYPTYPIINLNANKLDPKYLNVYDIPFLASYIRYSELSLLGSGMRDETVRKKLYFLHYHVGTILFAYRKFIWEDLITLEDLKAWLPLLSKFWLKDRIMRCTKFSNQYKQFLNACLNPMSFEFQNLELLNELYPDVTIEIEDLANNCFQEAFYKFLIIMKKNNVVLTYEKAIRKFYQMEGFLASITLEELPKYDFCLVEYLREPTNYLPLINRLEDFQKFSVEKVMVHEKFLEEEYDIERLKSFYCELFLGLNSQTFEMIFVKIPPNNQKWYRLLHDLYQAKFPLSLKEGLYQRFMQFGDLRSFLEEYIDDITALKNFYYKKVFTYIDSEHPVTTLDFSKFTLLTIPLEQYSKSNKMQRGIIKVDIQTDSHFFYQRGCLLGLEEKDILRVDESHCYMKKKDVHPNFLVAFDTVSFDHLTARKSTGYPIVVINTEAYAKKMIQNLEAQFAAFDWDTYIKGKRDLSESLKGHPWLMSRYFNIETLYQDVLKYQERLDIWMQEEVPSTFLKYQLQVLERMILLNEELEKNLSFETENEKTSQYRKKMIQYEQLV